MRVCHVCGDHLSIGQSHIEKHHSTHTLCVFCKNLVITNSLSVHERDCRGFQRYRPFIHEYDRLMEQAITSDNGHDAVTCFCGEIFTLRSLAKHHHLGGCSIRKCRVCGINISHLLGCKDHRCVSFLKIFFLLLMLNLFLL